MVDAERETQRTQDSVDAAGPRHLVLKGVLPDDPAVLPLTREHWVLGRGEECNVRLARDRVSRKHAEVLRRGPIHMVRDLGSTNGTYVDGERVQEQVLKPGSVLRLGEWLGVIEESGTDELPCRFTELAPGLWGGAHLARVLRPLLQAAQSTVPVLLIGRTGAGKERFARALHVASGQDRVLHTINCAAIAPSLAEAELFGYRKGAFTGADRNYAGHLRAANGGTLFLDEIADLPLPVQAKLLRALDTGEMAPLGESAEVRFEARIVAACQEPLANLVAAGKFREDLAARLSGLTIRIPELRERISDIPALFALFLRNHSGGTSPAVSARLYECLCLHDWPGNVRELELLARRLLAVYGLEPELRRSHLPEELRVPASLEQPSPKRPPREGVNRSDIEKLAAALKESRGNVNAAARLVGISRQRAHRLIASRQLADLVSASRNVAEGGENGRSE